MFYHVLHVTIFQQACLCLEFFRNIKYCKTFFFFENVCRVETIKSNWSIILLHIKTYILS